MVVSGTKTAEKWFGEAVRGRGFGGTLSKFGISYNVFEWNAVVELVCLSIPSVDLFQAVGVLVSLGFE